MDGADSALESDSLCAEVSVGERMKMFFVYVCIQDRVIVNELPEHQLRVRLERRVKREEDLAMLLDR